MGKQIRIYLADGTSSGIRHAEITNWSGQALACPRARFSDLKDWQEVKRPGVYFLFGTGEESGNDAVYVGESEVVLERLSSHLTGKDFWIELIAFTSKDDNLTKGHVKYLESRLIQLALAANRYQVTNTASPQLPALPRADRDAMEEFLVSVRALLGVLGHRVLEPFAFPSLPAASDSGPTVSKPVLGTTATDVTQVDTSTASTFSLHISGIKATATRTDEGLVVLTGSEAVAAAQGSLSGGYRAIRERLIESGALTPSNGKLQLTKDHLFTSPSQAAAVLVGYAINGRDAWRLNNGTTFGEYEQMISNALVQELGDAQETDSSAE